MIEDPIVAEVRAVRRKLQEESGNDMAVFFANLRLVEAAYADRVVSLEVLTAQKVST